MCLAYYLQRFATLRFELDIGHMNLWMCICRVLSYCQYLQQPNENIVGRMVAYIGIVFILIYFYVFLPPLPFPKLLAVAVLRLFASTV